MPPIQSQSAKEELKFVDLNISPETLTLYYLAEITKIDLMTMTLLFEKIGTGLYYLFYMLAKRKISFPSEANLLKAIKFSDTVEALDNNYPNNHKIPDKDKEIFAQLIRDVVDKRYIRVRINSLDKAHCTHVTRVNNSSNKSELDSSIKKYIRKEKRRLDKSGQVYTLFETDHPNRLNLIEKIYTLFESKVAENNIEDLRALIGNLINGYNN